MSQRHPLTRRASTSRLALPVVLAAVLSGCGVADTTAFRPGVAAAIEGETVRVDEVDEVADSLCRVLQSDPRFEGQGVASSQLRNAAARGLTLHAMGEQLLEEYDVDLPEGQDHGAEQLRLSYGSAAPEDLRAATPAFTGDQYLYDVLVALGADETGSAEDQEAALRAGVERARAWQQQADIQVNPAFDAVEIGEQEVLTSRNELSVATSEYATGAAGADEAWSASLPESQRCTGGA